MAKTELELLEGLIDAGPFIGALFVTDPRYSEAFPLLEAARLGQLPACTTTGILSEVYAALTWYQAQPVRSSQEAALIAMELAAAHNLTARRIHDARRAAAVIAAGVSRVYTYDVNDWKIFQNNGLAIAEPASSLRRLSIG